MDLFERAAGRREETASETVEGTLERIVYAGTSGEFTVARLKVEGRQELLTVVGALLGVPVGARLRVVGRQESNPRFGPQLRIASFTEVAPATVEGIRRYLGSGLIKGIGPEFASRIVTTFGVRTLEILDAEPQRIAEVPGIGKVRAASVRDAWAAQREIRRVMVFLQGYGVSPAFAARIYKRYGAAAIARVRENPYRLAFDVWGIGFLSADKLAVALGIAKDADVRLDAGVRHVLEEAGSAGHCYVRRDALVDLAAQRLDVDQTLIDAAIDRLGRSGDVALESAYDATGEGVAVFEAGLYRAERAAAAELHRLAGAEATAVLPGENEVRTAIAGYEASAGLALARQQAEAIFQVLRHQVVVITGGPGVGKTTIVRGIVKILGEARLTIALAAPTGRAAKRLSEATGQPATTLHRMLEWRPAESAFARNAARPLESDVVIVDEASMLDVRLAADLFAALSTGTRVVLVGDVDQLPSVGPGAVLSDIIRSERVPTVRLTEIFRQAAASLIIRNAHRIHEGDMPELGSPAPGGPAADARDFFFLEEDDPARAALLVRDLVGQRLPRRYNLSPHDIQILAPMHRGDLGAGNLNGLMQEALTAGAPELRRGARVFRVGDRVMQMRNNYDKDVFNGDIGRVERVDGEAAEMLVHYEDRAIAYEGEETEELTLAYAVTVHKSQGSEYAAVVIPLHTQHFVMLQRNLLYTAVTRGKRLVVIVGSKKALGLAVRNGQVAARNTRLSGRLAALASGG